MHKVILMAHPAMQCLRLLFIGTVWLSFSLAESAPTQVVMAQAPDVKLTLYGGLKAYPHFASNLDLNAEDTNFDFILEESGIIDHDEVTVRNEFRLGVRGEGDNWTFKTVLEADFNLDKNNTDRGVRSSSDERISDDNFSAVSGMTGEDFGVEKLDFTYDFSEHGFPVTLFTGWDTNYLDLETGSVLYGDDHPYIGLRGQLGGLAWEAMTLFIFDDVQPGIGNDLDWRAYTLKASLPTRTLTWVPFYAFSDNTARNADVHYLGLEAFGKIGRLVPKAEFVYALGDKEYANRANADIRAYAGYTSLEFAFAPLLQPYAGGYFISGDDDGTDGTINAFNPITNAARYTSTFGMENAFIYRFVPVLGSNLYSNTPDNLGNAPGYGGVGNGSTAVSPGMYTAGFGIKGKRQAFAYKAQFQQIWLAATGALADDLGKQAITKRFGWEFDLQLTYTFSKNFSLGNTLALFAPGPAIQDIRNTAEQDFDQLAVLDTIELRWQF